MLCRIYLVILIIVENIFAKTVSRNLVSDRIVGLGELSSNEAIEKPINDVPDSSSSSHENSVPKIAPLVKKEAPQFLILKESDVKVPTAGEVPPYLDHKPWPLGVVPYFFDHDSYDGIVAERVRVAMNFIEEASCLQFRPLSEAANDGPWIHITNPDHIRDCVHENSTSSLSGTEKVMVLGLDCMQIRNILHSLMHALGFKDEVTHPQRDKFVRIKWENIHPRYRSLFHINYYDFPTKTTEYDPASIMQFHDRAYTKNGQATIEPLIPGLLINPSKELSPLDKLKLRMLFGHECNKRKVDKLVDQCKYALQSASGDEGDDNADSGDGNDDSDHGDNDANDDVSDGVVPSAEQSDSNEDNHLDDNDDEQGSNGNDDNQDANKEGNDIQDDNVPGSEDQDVDDYDPNAQADYEIKPYKDENYIDRNEGDNKNQDNISEDVYRKAASRVQNSKHKEKATTKKNINKEYNKNDNKKSL